VNWKIVIRPIIRENMAAGLPEEKWKEVYANLKTCHDKAYTVIDAAIKFEEENKKDQALQKYEEGLGLIDLALELRVECPSNPDITWEKGCVMLQKMRKTKKEVLGRIADIQVRQPPDPNMLPPPSYDEAMSLSPSLPNVPPTTPVPYLNGAGGGPPSFSAGGASGGAPSEEGASGWAPPSEGGTSGWAPPSIMTYQQLGDALNNLKVETAMQSAQVIYTHDNVQLYFISHDGVVSSSSEPSVLRILQLEGSAVGIMLPPDADKSVYNLLEDILHCIVTTEPIVPPRSRVKRDETRSAAVSRSIVSDKHRHKKRSHRDQEEDGEKKHHRRHRRHRRHHGSDHDDVIDGESVTSDSVSSSSKDSHRRHRGRKAHGYDLLHKTRHSKHLHYGLPVFGNYRTVLGMKPNEVVQVEEEKPQKVLGEKEKEEEEESDESSSSEGSSEDTVEEAEEVGFDSKDEKKRKKEEYKEAKRREKEEYKREKKREKEQKRSNSGKWRAKRFVMASNPYKAQESRLGSYISSGAQYISSGLVRGAEKASQYINSSTPKLLEKITPEPTPRQVSPGIAKSAEVARNVTGTAVVVTGYVANKVGSATMALGRYLAPHLQKHGTQLVSRAGGLDEKAAAERVEGVLTVAAGAVEGFSTVYTGLEQSASILGNSLTNNTVHIVEHKYGQPMGTVTGHTLHSIGNAYAATQNVRIFTPKNLAKKTAKDAGKAFVQDFRHEIRNHNSGTNQMNGDQKSLDKPGPSKS
ncbi:hypothetical protein LSTR_LSTR009391, partial [Laodelphax striatellus]